MRYDVCFSFIIMQISRQCRFELNIYKILQNKFS